MHGGRHQYRMMQWLLAAIVAMGCSAYAQVTTPVSDLDLTQYQGDWFEVARIPNRFQKKCQKNVMATYQLRSDGYLTVTNTCVKKNGKRAIATGLARRADAGTSGRLAVSLFDVLGWRPFWGHYWVLYRDDTYTVAVVGDDRARYGWVLSRQKTLTKDQRNTVMAILDANGYDVQSLQFTVHD
jgi:apolipoprotein D and lipocalin family protein